MARSRNLKPGFFKNEDLAACGMMARILFAGLWCFADRQGRLEDRPKRIKAEIFPYDDSVDVDAELNVLDNAKFIKRYEKNREKYIQIINFTKHQNPHIKEQDSTIPAPDKHRTRPGNSGTCHALTLNPITDSLNPLTTAVDGLDAKAWETWMDYRKKIGKPLKPVSIPAAQRKLAALGVNQMASVEHSIANGWIGLFSADKSSSEHRRQPKGKIQRAIEACDKVFGPLKNQKETV